MPRRSVTRFFIPLIDVLILLFCIFLLMPFVSSAPEPDPGADSKAATPEAKLPDDVKTLQAMLKEERQRVEKLQREKHSDYLKKHLAVAVLEIDPATGALYYTDPQRQDIKTQAEAIRYINRQRLQASAGGSVKDVLFLIRFPRKVSGFPTEPQVEQIRDWFKDAAYQFDVPAA
jgi:hypothetical protein